MPHGFGHLIGAWIFGKIYCYLFKQKLSKFAWGALLFGAILPDADFFLDWIFCFKVHRTFSHSFVGAIGAGIILYILLKIINAIKKNKISKPAVIAIFLSIGVLTHIGLDLTTDSSGLQIFWPFDTDWITLQSELHHNSRAPTYEELKQEHIYAIIDIGMGAAWMAYFFLKDKLRFD